MELNRKQGRNSEIFEGSLKGASPPVPQKGPPKAGYLSQKWPETIQFSSIAFTTKLGISSVKQQYN